jgi:hypothetical protein
MAVTRTRRHPKANHRFAMALMTGPAGSSAQARYPQGLGKVILLGGRPTIRSRAYSLWYGADGRATERPASGRLRQSR